MMKRTAKVVLLVVIALMLMASLWVMPLQGQAKEQSKVVISEICFFPISGEPEWIELKSISNKPVSLAGWQITNGERLRIVLPEKMPEMPPQAHVLIMFDGKGDAKYVSGINDLSFAGDDLVVLHSPVQLEGNMFGDMTGQCALYAADVRNAASIRSFVTWGSSTGNGSSITKGLADAVNTGLWPSRDVLFTVARSSGGIKGPVAVIKPGGSIGFYGDCSGIQESNWLVFGPAETSPGKENPLPAPQLHLPGNGIRVDRSVGTFSWVKVPGAASYHFQICEDQECTHIVIDVPNCREPLYRPMEALPIDAVYYWRVRAIDDSGYVSGWSTTYKLTVGYPKTKFISRNISRNMASAQAATFSVSGKVTDSVSGNGLSGVKVKIGALSATTDAAGGYTIINVPKGKHTITATLAHYTIPPLAIEVKDKNLVGCDLVATGDSKVLGAVALPARKDTTMLCLDGCPKTGNHSWDISHMGTAHYCDHASWQCWAVATTMLNRYCTGSIFQDEVKFHVKGGGPPEGDLPHGKAGGATDAEAQSGLTWALQTDAAGVNYKKVDPTSAQMKAYIEGNRSMMWSTSAHWMAVSGYRYVDKRLQGRFLNTDNDGTSQWFFWGDPTAWPTNDFDSCFIPNAGLSGRAADPDISRDTDGDGVYDFDEKQRFKTDQNKDDSDDDGVKDKFEVICYTFLSNGSFDSADTRKPDPDGDGLRAELDKDSDDGGIEDGIEDANRNGVVDTKETDPLNKNDDRQINIIKPVQTAPEYVGPHDNPNKINIEVEVKRAIDGVFIPGLIDKGYYTVKIGDKNATILNILQKADRYVQEIMPPTQDTDGKYDLNVSITSAVPDLEKEAICYGEVDIEIDAKPKSKTVKKGGTATYDVEVENNGTCKDRFDIGWGWIGSGWSVSVTPFYLILDPGKKGKATLKVTAPTDGECDKDSTVVTVTARSRNNLKSEKDTKVVTIVDYGKCPDDTKCYAYKCENYKCKKIRKPGCDHPDESADVSTCSRCSQYPSFTSSSNPSGPKIAVLSNGFPTYFLNLLAEFDESADLVSLDASSEELSNYSVFVVPTGGFYGISSIPSFKDKLEQYVSDGGTLIVLAQQHGYEYEPVPGDLSGYGWLEDQSCHYRSTGISTYHVILSGQDSVIVDANVDGYFTKYPDNAAILLSRTKNGMPAMLMYEYGNGTGTVIVATLYTDWANSYRQATKDGKNLIRDMIAWAKDPKDIPDYAAGDTIEIPINVTNNANVTAHNVSFRVRDPDKNVVGYVNVTNVSILQNETKVINFTYTAPSKLGIWWIDYLLYGDELIQTTSEAQRFAVSKYAENPDGFVYHGKKISYAVSSQSENYAYGSNGTFTIRIWNHGDTGKTITCWWSFPHNYWAKHDPIYGTPGTTRPGHRSNLYRTLTVPAHGEVSFVYSIPVYSYDRLWADFYEGDETSHTHLGGASRAFYCFRPSVDLDVKTGKDEYAIGENVLILSSIKNKQSVGHNITVTVKTLDPDNNKIYEESFDINLSAYASGNKTLNFTLPVDSKYGIYIVTADAYENENKIGSDSTYFEVSKAYFAELSFDKPDKVYKVRQSMIVYLNITNVGAALWNSTVNTSIPDLAFEDSKYVSLGPYGTKNISYDLNTGNVTAGKHDVIVTIEIDNSTVKDCFFIPESNLVLSIGRTSYNAGENLIINISNTGGVDTTFINCSIKFSDKTGFVIYENETQGNISAGENATISFEIPDQAVNGDYQLIVSCKDNKTGKLSKLSKSCEVSGLEAIVTSVTDKKAYFCDENVTILTNITNLDGAIVNGTLNLKIYSKSKQVKPKAKVMSFDSDQLDGIVTNVSYQEKNIINDETALLVNDINPSNINISNESTGLLNVTSPGGFGTTGTHIKLGIDRFAHIADYDLGYGLQYPVGTEHLAIGWWGEGFYYGYYANATLHQGWSYEGSPYVSGLTFVSEEKTDTDTEGEYVVVLRDIAEDCLEITHDFLLHKSEKYVILKVDLKNIGSDKITGLKYRRVCDWDMDRSASGDYWDYLEDTDGKPIMMAWQNHYGALAPASSTPAERWDADAWDDMSRYDADVDDADPNGRRFDGCVYFEWESDLNPDESNTIIMYYVLGDSKDEIISGYDAAEAEAGFLTAVIWQKNITVNVSESETKNIVTEINIHDDLKNATGKLDLISTLYNHINSSQVINQSDRHSFFITDKNTSLTLETNKPVYKPNETVMIYGEVKNNAELTDDYNLSIKKDEVEILSDAFTLDPGESHNFTTNTSSNASFTLVGTVDGVTVTDIVSVEAASINVSIIAPDIVGLADFDVGVLIENIGKIYADLNVSINSTWNITVPEGESRLLETTKNITKNTTLNVNISGDVNKTIQKEIIFGENSKINLTPADTYLEGAVEIPFTINNTGTLDSEFNATFSISSPDEQTISRSFFVPAGGNITDSVSFNLTKGAHLLRYTSPFEEVETMINVLSPPEFNVTSIYPEEMNFTIGQNVILVFEVENIGGSEGEAALTLEMPDFEDTNRTWIRAGARGNISFNFTIPDDLEEKSYKGIYELDGKRDEFTYSVQGANISVNVSLDKNLYEDGETAVLTLTVKNNRNMDLSLYSRVKFNEYDNTTDFNLSAFESEILLFNVPVNFDGDNKILYTVYMDSGRSLYINSIYVYEKKPDVPLRLYTDKDVYNMGDEVTINIVDVTRTDLLNLTAPNFTYSNTISGPTTLKFTLPELRSGTYYVEYTFGNFSSSYPFDVVGYSARILEADLDREKYYAGTVIKLGMNIEANKNVSGLLRTWIYGPDDELIGEFETNKTLRGGENEIEIDRCVLATKSGFNVHAIVYGFYAELSGHSLTSLVSGAEYFDATNVLNPDIPDMTLLSAGKNITRINVSSLNLSEIDETNKSSRIKSRYAYKIDSSLIKGSTGNFTLQSTNISNANLITAYKIDDKKHWIRLNTTTINRTTLSFTMNAGERDSTVVLASKEATIGGMSVAILPKVKEADAGETCEFTVRVRNTQNFDEVVDMEVTLSGIPAEYQANLSWFNWVEYTSLVIPPREYRDVSLRLDIPAGVSGEKSFGIIARGTFGESKDYGVVEVR